jgi:hypothetical protein
MKSRDNSFKKKEAKDKKNFISKADKKQSDNVANFKSVCIHFSKNDYKLLEKITSTESRSKMNAIRHAMRVYASNL